MTRRRGTGTRVSKSGPSRLGAQLREAPSLDLSIVIPFYYTGRQVLSRTLAAVVESCDALGISYEVIAVDDGGTDDTHGALQDVNHPHLHLLRLPENLGKGGALLSGFSQSRGKFIGFIDADGDISPSHLADYFKFALGSDADIVLADKTHPESSNAVEVARQMTSKVMHKVNGKLLRLPTLDTQTGAKLYRRQFLAEAVPIARERGFALDVELFVLARALGYRRVRSMPVAIDRDGGSTVSAKSVAKTGAQVMRIWARDVSHTYGVRPHNWAEERGPKVERRAEAVPEMIGERDRAVLPTARSIPEAEQVWDVPAAPDALPAEWLAGIEEPSAGDTPRAD